MRTSQTFSISFLIRKKKNQPETALLYSRITVDGRSLEFSLKRDLPIKKWNQSAGRMKGNSIISQSINRKIDNTKNQLYAAYDKLREQGQLITAQLLKNRFLGTDQEYKSLICLLEYHNLKMKKVLKHGTLKNYSTTEIYLKDFLKTHKRTSDIYLKQIDYEFTLGFEHYLRSKPGLQNNGVMKHMERFKKLMNLAENLSWIEKNPSKKFKLRFDKVDMIFLSLKELEKVKAGVFEKPVLKTTADIFLFACFTGLSYIDVKNLNKDHLQMGVDGRNWIFTRRSKTNTTVRIPLLKEAEQILEYYENHIKTEGTDKLLPVYSNQKINYYLKEIARIVNIKKNLSFHTARHTFATTVTLANGVPMETVSKLLGHHKIATTQIYARVLDTKISGDMEVLREKLTNSKFI